MNEFVEPIYAGGMQNSRINSRIHSVDDPEFNRQLFSFYEKLIGPFREFERMHEIIHIGKTQIEILNQDKKRIPRTTIRKFISRSIIFFIIAFVLAVASAFALMYCVSEAVVIEMGLKLEEMGALFNLAFEDIYFGIIPLTLGIGISTIITIIKLVSNINEYNDEIARLKDEIAKAEKGIEQRLPALSEAAKLIPPDYRYSTALDFFVTAYSNSKVDNLKEAINLFDTNQYRDKMLSSQQLVLNSLSQIQFNQMMMAQQLSSLESTVWASNIFF